MGVATDLERGAADDDQYEVVIVRVGTRSCRRSEVFLNHGLSGDGDGAMTMDYFLWVARNEHRTVLVDTGFSPSAGASRGRIPVRSVPQIYADLGIDTAADHTVVLTHAHYDHIGNLNLFPAAQFVMSEREYAFWTGEMGQRGQFAWATEPSEIDALVLARDEGRVQLFAGDLALAPGIDLMELGGHTPGQAVVRVRTAEGDVLLASDAVHYYEEYERDMPFVYVADLPAMYAGYDRIRALVSSGQITHVVAGHDPDTLDRFRRLEDGPLAGIAATIGSPRSPTRH